MDTQSPIKNSPPATDGRQPKSRFPIRWLAMGGVMAGFMGGLLLSMTSQTDRIARVVKIDNTHLAAADTSPAQDIKRQAPNAFPKTYED